MEDEKQEMNRRRSVRAKTLSNLRRTAVRWGVALSLDVRRILEKREHTFFAIFGKGVEVKQFVIGGRGVNFEIARVNDHPEWRVNGEGNAIHQAVRDLNGMDLERPDLDSLVWTQSPQIGIIE